MLRSVTPTRHFAVALDFTVIDGNGINRLIFEEEDDKLSIYVCLLHAGGVRDIGIILVRCHVQAVFARDCNIRVGIVGMREIVMHVEPAARRGREHIVFEFMPVLVRHFFVAEAVEIFRVFPFATVMRLNAGASRYGENLLNRLHVVPECVDHCVLHGGCARLVRKVVLATFAMIVLLCTVLCTASVFRVDFRHIVSERICLFHVVPRDFVLALDIGKELIAAVVGALVIRRMSAFGTRRLRFLHPFDRVISSAARRKHCHRAKQERARRQNADQFFTFHSSSLFLSIFD